MQADRKQFLEMLDSAGDKAVADFAKANPTPATTWSAAFWPDGSQKTIALALAGDMALAAGTSEVVAVEAKKDGKELGRVKVEGKILINSLAASAGNVFVVTEGGSVLRLNP